jgi:hypothetical protein
MAVEWHSPTARDWAGNPQTLRSSLDHIDSRTVDIRGLVADRVIPGIQAHDRDIEDLKRRVDSLLSSVAELKQLIVAHVQPAPQPEPDDSALIRRLAAGDSRGNRILFPEQLIKAARETGLDLAVGCIVYIQESSGGRNIYDGKTSTCPGVVYPTRGTEVTEANYQVVKDNRRTCGRKGVGPTQITDVALQEQADALGGAWRPDVNTRVGFAFMRSCIEENGGNVERGMNRYNSGSPDSGYGTTVAGNGLLAEWRAIVEGGA